jgi:hypothetical protein
MNRYTFFDKFNILIYDPTYLAVTKSVSASLRDYIWLNMKDSVTFAVWNQCRDVLADNL